MVSSSVWSSIWSGIWICWGNCLSYDWGMIGSSDWSMIAWVCSSNWCMICSTVGWGSICSTISWSVWSNWCNNSAGTGNESWENELEWKRNNCAIKWLLILTNLMFLNKSLPIWTFWLKFVFYCKVSEVNRWEVHCWMILVSKCLHI